MAGLDRPKRDEITPDGSAVVNQFSHVAHLATELGK